MKFLTWCRNVSVATNRWMKRHPWYCALIFALFFGATLWHALIVVPLFLVYMLSTLVIMFGEAIWMEKTNYYATIRCEHDTCEKCGKNIQHVKNGTEPY